jgi:hypothetical protein
MTLANQWSCIREARLCLLGLSVTVGLVWLGLHSCWHSRLLVSIRFLGYTNKAGDIQAGPNGNGLVVHLVASGARAALLEASNASPFAVVRGRSPKRTFEGVAGTVEFLPTGWSVLQPHQCELFELEPPASGGRWKLNIECEPLRDSNMGASGLQPRLRQLQIWLRDHKLPIPVSQKTPPVQVSSDWIW